MPQTPSSPSLATTSASSSHGRATPLRLLLIALLKALAVQSTSDRLLYGCVCRKHDPLDCVTESLIVAAYGSAPIAGDDAAGPGRHLAGDPASFRRGRLAGGDDAERCHAHLPSRPPWWPCSARA